MRCFMLACAFVVVSYAHAERATERYAPAQLSVAAEFLERARAAAALEDYRLAGNLASQAALDARLAWRMTDHAYMRVRAEAIARQAQALVRSSREHHDGWR